MKNTLLAFWKVMKELVIGGVFAAACLVSGAALLTGTFGGRYSIKIGATFYELPSKTFDAAMVALILWVVFLILYGVRLILSKNAKN